MGDPAKVMLLETTVKVMEEQDLLQNVRNVGKTLEAGMLQLQVRHSLTASFTSQ